VLSLLVSFLTLTDVHRLLESWLFSSSEFCVSTAVARAVVMKLKKFSLYQVDDLEAESDSDCYTSFACVSVKD
jgi:TPP-dependent indolepyruvate ferredoxin oxidoreductase alpha subunit